MKIDTLLLAASAACIGAGMWLTAAPAQAASCAMSDVVCIGECQAQLARSGQGTPDNISKICTGGTWQPGGPGAGGGCSGILGREGSKYTGTC
jgi:hypothetical protein